MRTGGEGLRSVRMRLRYARGWGLENSLAEMAMARKSDSTVKVSLYPESAQSGTRPVVEFVVDPLIEIEVIPQRSVCTVVGWPFPGRAVLVTVGGVTLMSLTPCRPPLRGKRFGKDEA